MGEPGSCKAGLGPASAEVIKVQQQVFVGIDVSKVQREIPRIALDDSLVWLLANRPIATRLCNLADIYLWFTEDFGTADLKDAKTLLGELTA